MELTNIFKKQLIGFDHYVIKDIVMENNKMFLHMSVDFSENRFFMDYVNSLTRRLGRHINRPVDYVSHRRAWCAEQLELEIDYNNPINTNIITLNKIVIADNILEKDNFYPENSLIVNLVFNLKNNVEIHNFKLKDNIVYFENKPVLKINIFEDSIHLCNRGGCDHEYPSWNYHFYILNDLSIFQLLEAIKASYNYNHTEKLSYGSVGRENRNWIIGDNQHFEGDWSENLFNPKDIA